MRVCLVAMAAVVDVRGNLAGRVKFSTFLDTMPFSRILMMEDRLHPEASAAAIMWAGNMCFFVLFLLLKKS